MLIANPIYDVVFKFLMEDAYLTDKRRTELEILLSVFDQRNVADNEQEKQLANQLYQEKLQTLQRMRKAGLSEADTCSFLNISPQELEQMTHFDSAQ